jgi:hypothetical protein
MALVSRSDEIVCIDLALTQIGLKMVESRVDRASSR